MSDGDEDIFATKTETNGGGDLFADVNSEVSLSETSPSMSPTSVPSASLSTSANSESRSFNKSNTNDQSIVITITDPEKIGDGMYAFMVYKVNTKTSLPTFRKPELSVKRRFSDFLGLHEKLQGKHLPNGIIIPPAPEKNVVGMTKLKISKEDSTGSDFFERRRAALERYMNRLARHQRLSMDPDFSQFLEFEGDLPKSTNTQALSGASVLKMFKNVGDAMGKIAFKMDEVDQWFEQKQNEVENTEKQLIKLHSSFENLVTYRKDLASSTDALAVSCSALSNAEENTLVARALSQLAVTQERVGEIHKRQADVDFYCLSEVIKDYIALIQAVKETLSERVKAFKYWKDAELALTKKREQKVKLELANKTDKISLIESEIVDCEKRVEKEKQNFDMISEAIKDELSVFDFDRVHDLKRAVVKCLEEMVANQEQVIQCWETYLPDAKAIM